MIQDILPHQLHNQYHPQTQPEKEDLVLFFDGGKLLMKGQEGPFLQVADFPPEARFRYLFCLDEKRFFLLLSQPPIQPGWEFFQVRHLREQARLPREYLYAIFTGKHLADWYRDTRFCGRCGRAMTHSAQERAMTCSCGYTAYPRIMPAVIVGVIHGDCLLLTRYRTGFGHNALIAGFTEIGETAEETVAREVMEEAGLRVKDITYYKSQPWGIANDLLMGFFCRLDGDPAITMDTQELKYAAWVKREDIQLQPDHASLTNEMMQMFKNGVIV